MNVFSGILSRSNNKIRKGFFHSLRLDPVYKPSFCDSTPDNKFAYCNHASNDHHSSTHFIDKGHIIVGDADLYNRNELIKTNSGATDLELILDSYAMWGKDCVKHLVGDFAFCIWDERKQLSFCACDPIRQKTLYYYIDDDFFFFANRVHILSSFSFAAELDDEWILNFFLTIFPSKENTAFKRIKKLLPGHTMTVTGDNIESASYWNLDDTHTPDIPRNIEEAAQVLKWHLQNAVEVRIKNHDNIGVELTGGIDSSCITILAQNFLLQQNRSAVAFTNVLPKSELVHKNLRDEWDVASRIASQHNIKRHIGIDANPQRDIQLISTAVDIMGYPTSFPLALNLEGIYEEAKALHVDKLFSGFGGNELVSETENVRYLFDLLKKWDLEGVNRFFKSQGNTELKASARTAYHVSRFLMHTERKNYRKIKDARWRLLLLKRDVLDNREIREQFNRHYYYPPDLSLREKGLYRINAGITSERITTCGLIAGAYGIVYSYPLLHPPLLQYYYNLPDKWKASDKMGRAMIRRAMRGTIPAEIIDQPKHTNSSTVPFMKFENRKNYEELLEWCLDLPYQHKVFNYFDRGNLLNYNDKTFGIEPRYNYKNLRTLTMMAMFMDKREKVDYNELR